MKAWAIHVVKLLLSSFALFLAVITVLFFLLELAPGDPVQSLIGDVPITDAVREQIIAAYGLDQPAWQRYFIYLGNVLRGDLGYSYATNSQPVLEIILSRAGNTLALAIPAFILSTVGGIVLGAIAARTRRKWLDAGISGTTVGLFSVPNFWFGMLLIIVFAIWLDWLPTGGMAPYGQAGIQPQYLILPVLTMATTELAYKARIMRSSMIESLGQDFIDTARSKGLSSQTVLWRHADAQRPPTHDHRRRLQPRLHPRGVDPRGARLRVARDGAAVLRRHRAPQQHGRPGRGDRADRHHHHRQHPHRPRLRARRPAPARALLPSPLDPGVAAQRLGRRTQPEGGVGMTLQEQEIASGMPTAPEDESAPVTEPVSTGRTGGARAAWRSFFRRPTTLIYLGVLVFFALVSVLGPFFVDSPTATIYPKLLPPSGEHLLGTDMLGRDYLARVVYGGQVSLLVGFSVALLCMTIGIVIGGLAGYYGGAIDTAMVKVAEFFQVLPGIVLTLVAAALLGANVFIIVGILALTMWPGVARIVRAEAMRIAQLGYVESAKAAGFRGPRIILSDVVPNLMPPVLVATSMTVGRAILIESGLAYLGVGDPSKPSWGALLNTAQSYMNDAWWLAVFPGTCIFLVVLAVNMLGDALNDAFNPTVGRVK